MNLKKGIEDLLRQADEEENKPETEEVEEKTEVEEKVEEKPEEKDYKAILNEPGMKEFIKNLYGEVIYDKMYGGEEAKEEVVEEEKEQTKGE